VLKKNSTEVWKAAGAMGSATLLSRLMGVVREQVFAYWFGAGHWMDAYNVAFRIPNLLRDLFAEGAMSASLVPVFTQARLEEGPRRAWRVAGLVFRSVFLGVAGLSLFGMFLAPWLVHFYASSFRWVPGKFELTVSMTRILFLFFPCVALAAAFMGILNACGVFFLPAFASALFNVSSVLVGLTFVNIFSHWPILQPIEGMALGVVVGGLVQAFCQYPALKKVGYTWVSREREDPLWYRDQRLRQMLGMMLPGTLGLAATQLNLLVNTILATSQIPGSVSWLNYAFRLMQFPIGVFGVSLASATLPQVALQWAEKDYPAVERTLLRSLRSVFACNLPAALGLAFLGPSIVRCLFQYGHFRPEDTQATAWALAMYAVGLPSYSMVKVLVPACYALGNTKIPVLSSVFSVLITLFLNTCMVRWMGYGGLALGTSIAAIFNGLFLTHAIHLILKKKGVFFSWKALWYAFFAYVAVSLSMVGVALFIEGLLEVWIPDVFFPISWWGVVLGRCLRLGFVVMASVAWFLGISYLLKLSEMVQVLAWIGRRMKKR
jgi:putative peptidoglycan lipid II flippase